MWGIIFTILLASMRTSKYNEWINSYLPFLARRNLISLDLFCTSQSLRFNGARRISRETLGIMGQHTKTIICYLCTNLPSVSNLRLAVQSSISSEYWMVISVSQKFQKQNTGDIMFLGKNTFIAKKYQWYLIILIRPLIFKLQNYNLAFYGINGSK